MSCQWQENLAYRFADGSLEPAQKQIFADHLGNCTVCQARVAEAERLEAVLKESLTSVPAPAGFAARMANVIAAEREERRPRFAFPAFFGHRRLVTAFASLLLAVLMVAAAGGPEGALAVVQRALFFIPGMGINAVDTETLVAARPVSARLGGTTFTVQALLSDATQTTVEFKVTGLPGGKQGWDKPIQAGSDPMPARPATPPPAPVLRDGSGKEYPLRASSWSTGGSMEENFISGTLMFAALPADTQVVDLAVPVPAVLPEGVLAQAGLQASDLWQAHVALAHPTESGLAQAKPQTTTATVAGTTLRVTASAVEGGRLAVLVESDLPGEAHVISLIANGANPDRTLTLRDAQGRTYKRLEMSGGMILGNRELQQTLYFEQPGLLAGDLTLRVDSVEVVEDAQASVTIPLAGHKPGDTWELNREVDLGGHKVLLKSARLAPEGSATTLYVDVDLGDKVDGRLLSSFSVTGAGSWMSSNGAHEGGQMSYFGVDVDPNAQSVTLNLANPMVSVDGPWELTFPAGGK